MEGERSHCCTNPDHLVRATETSTGCIFHKSRTLSWMLGTVIFEFGCEEFSLLGWLFCAESTPASEPVLRALIVCNILHLLAS